MLNKIIIPSKLCSLKNVRAFLSSQLYDLNVPEVDSNLIILCVDEICANLVIHANKKLVEDTIEVTIQKENDLIIATVLDHFISFNPIQSKSDTIEYLIKEKKKGGVGLMLVNKIMDKIEYKIGNSYNICNLYKYLQVL